MGNIFTENFYNFLKFLPSWGHEKSIVSQLYFVLSELLQVSLKQGLIYIGVSVTLYVLYQFCMNTTEKFSVISVRSQHTSVFLYYMEQTVRLLPDCAVL